MVAQSVHFTFMKGEINARHSIAKTHSKIPGDRHSTQLPGLCFERIGNECFHHQLNDPLLLRL